MVFDFSHGLQLGIPSLLVAPEDLGSIASASRAHDVLWGSVFSGELQATEFLRPLVFITPKTLWRRRRIFLSAHLPLTWPMAEEDAPASGHRQKRGLSCACGNVMGKQLVSCMRYWYHGIVFGNLQKG